MPIIGGRSEADHGRRAKYGAASEGYVVMPVPREIFHLVDLGLYGSCCSFLMHLTLPSDCLSLLYAAKVPVDEKTCKSKIKHWQPRDNRRGDPVYSVPCFLLKAPPISGPKSSARGVGLRLVWPNAA